MSDDHEPRRRIAELDYASQTAEAAERLKFQISLVDRGIQSLMLINGGALVALFTLLGSKAPIHLDTRLLWLAFAAFAGGLALTLLANLGAFVSQWQYYVTCQYAAWDAQKIMVSAPSTYDTAIVRAASIGFVAQMAGTVSAVLALVAFVVGCGLAFAGVLPG